MSIEELHFRDFRNIQEQVWNLVPSLNVLEGENAQGKTNFLEAVYFLANGRSFRGTEYAGLIRFGASETQLHGRWSHEGLESRLDMKILPEGREAKFQGKAIVRLAPVQAGLRVLVFTPDSSTLFRSPPQARRKYFDHAISVQRPAYATALSRYQRVLRQRNQLLEHGGDPTLEAAFDLQWAECALAVMKERESYLEEIRGPWRRRFRDLLGSEEALDFQWRGELTAVPNLETEALLKALDGVRREEKRRGRSLLGPQRDDLQVTFAGHPVKEVASQGQQRMLVIALKLAEADLFQAQSGKSPVFLLDDLGSELDARHQGLLLRILGALKAQTLLTTAQQGAFASLSAKTFRVKAGRLFE